MEHKLQNLPHKMAERERWRVREGERERGGRFNQRKEVTIFIRNLPHSLDCHGLRGIFQRAGRISDTYIPFRNSRPTKARFGFVRFWNPADASRSVLMFNNAVIRGHMIKVCKAKFEKPSRLRKLPAIEPTFFNPPREKWEKVPKLQEKAKGSNLQKLPKTVKRVRFIHEDQTDSFAVLGEVNSEFEEWLKRSLICTSEVPRDLGALTSALISGFGECTKVCSLSSHKFIITLPSVNRLEELLCNHEELSQWFIEVKKWDKSDFCDSRRVWLEIFGVPPHGWSWENFQRIANIWGSLVSLGKSIARTDSFNSMKVLIDTGVFKSIEGDVLLTIGDAGYRVQVKEVGTVVQVCQSPFRPTETSDSNGDVVGFEDLDNEVACKDNMAAGLEDGVGEETPRLQSDHISAHDVGRSDGFRSVSRNSLATSKIACFHSHKSDVQGLDDSDGHHSIRKEVNVVEETFDSRANSKSNSNSNSNPQEVYRSPGANECSSYDASESRTKTVSFSQNGYSVELFKVGQLVQSGTMGKSSDINAQEAKSTTVIEAVQATQEPDPLLPRSQPQDLEAFNLGNDADLNSQSTISAPPGFDVAITTKGSLMKRLEPKQLTVDSKPGRSKRQSVVTSSPKRAEVINKMKLSSVQQRCSRKKHIHCLGRRVTRSQAKKCNELLERRRSMRNSGVSGSEGEKETTLESESIKTTASMRKLAEESLEVGELLGLKVVANKENAIKRITQSLKNARVSKSIHKPI